MKDSDYLPGWLTGPPIASTPDRRCTSQWTDSDEWANTVGLPKMCQLEEGHRGSHAVGEGNKTAEWP